ncbi:glycosyltransferase family 4 protein [Alteromonas aestuariivivens]|nr:glycosyltransferase family 4 protein [Alteromonas aestuariivivens]
MATNSAVELTVFAKQPDDGMGYDVNDESSFEFRFIPANWNVFGRGLRWSSGFLRCYRETDCIIHFGDYKFLTIWVCLLLSVFNKKKFFLHGQGGYKNDRLVGRLIYIIFVALSDGYICYTEYSRKALLGKLPSFLHRKVFVVSNTLYFPKMPLENKVTHEKSREGQELLYLGRLRRSCGIEFLLEAATEAKLKVKVIGGGDEEYINALSEKYNSIATFYGPVFELEKQREIAQSCIAGVYGGNAGLSVVHYLYLGLPVIVHSDIASHMGPEPSYISHGYNGILFEKDNPESLINALIQIKSDDLLRAKLSENALSTFTALSKPSMADKMLQIVEGTASNERGHAVSLLIVLAFLTTLVADVSPVAV